MMRLTSFGSQRHRRTKAGTAKIHISNDDFFIPHRRAKDTTRGAKVLIKGLRDFTMTISPEEILKCLAIVLPQDLIDGTAKLCKKDAKLKAALPEVIKLLI